MPLSKGFSLIEMLILLFILGLVSAIALPKFQRSHQQLLLESSSKDVLALCQLAQSTAQHTNRVIRVTCERDADTNILSLTAYLPHKKTGVLEPKTVVIPTALTGTSTVVFTAIEFQSDRSWKMYNNATLLSLSTLSVHFASATKERVLSFFFQSRMMQLLEG